MSTLDLNQIALGLDGFQSRTDLPQNQNNATTPLTEFIKDAKKSGFIHQIRDQLYYIEIWLYNQIEGQTPYSVPFYLVNALALEESFFEFMVRGWIIFNTSFEVLERGATGKDGKINAPFIFRTDGRNRISIKIYPIPSTQTAFDIGTFEEALPKDKWEMCFDCVIYDAQDLPTDSAQVKKRKFYFWDERYQHFLEKNIEWSTSVQGLESIYGQTIEKPWELKDHQRSIPASFAIRSLIDTASLINPNNSFQLGNSVKIGYDELGSIDRPNINLNLFDPVWDGGYANESITTRLGDSYRKDLVFYTSPANTTVYEDLTYLLENGISQSGYPLFLRHGRHSKDKEWHLFGLDEYLKNAGRDQVERLIVEDGVEPQAPYIPRAPDGLGGDIRNFMSGVASRIKEYQFSPMVAIDDGRITNTPLHHYNFSTGEFNIYKKDNLASEVVDKMTSAGKLGLYGINRPGGHLLLNVNKTKTDGIMLKNMHSGRPFIPPELPKMEMMKDVLFLNEALSFKANGLTIRSPGRFLFIDYSNSNDFNPFDDRFLGQWMMTKVIHLFTQNNYITEVVANKIDSFSKIWNVFDQKL
jgi:hypothetical protein